MNGVGDGPGKTRARYQGGGHVRKATRPSALQAQEGVKHRQNTKNKTTQRSGKKKKKEQSDNIEFDHFPWEGKEESPEVGSLFQPFWERRRDTRRDSFPELQLGNGPNSKFDELLPPPMPPQAPQPPQFQGKPMLMPPPTMPTVFPSMSPPPKLGPSGVPSKAPPPAADPKQKKKPQKLSHPKQKNAHKHQHHGHPNQKAPKKTTKNHDKYKSEPHRTRQHNNHRPHHQTHHGRNHKHQDGLLL